MNYFCNFAPELILHTNQHPTTPYPAYEKGYIKLFKPESPTSPEQAYLLTPQGMDLLAELNSEDANMIEKVKLF